MVTFRFRFLTPELKTLVAGILLLSLGQGCKREDIQVYRVAKDPVPSADSAGTGGPRSEGSQAAPRPRVQFTLPPGWEDRGPEDIKAASFSITGSSNRAAGVIIVPLTGVPAGDLDFVNIARQQMNQEPLSEADLQKLTQPVSIGGGQGSLFELTSDKPASDSTPSVEMIEATLKKGDTIWLVKMSGEASLVKEQKTVFTNFLQSLKFEEADISTAPPAVTRRFSANSKEAPRAADTKPNWTKPAEWQDVPGGDMLVAKFTVSGKDGAKADVNVGQAGGGAGANILRWRNQLSLPPVSPEEAEKAGSNLDLPSGKSLLVDLKGTDGRTGQPARILGVISPHGNEMWFYKFMGNPELIEARKAEFLGFVRSITYPHAP